MNDFGEDFEVPHETAEQSPRVLIGFGFLDRPANDAAVEQIDDRVRVEKYPAYVGFQPGDVPRINLVRAGHVVGVRRPLRTRFF